MEAVCTVQVGETCTITWGGGPGWQIIDAAAAIDVFGPVMVGVIVGGGAWALDYLCGYIDGRAAVGTHVAPMAQKRKTRMRQAFTGTLELDGADDITRLKLDDTGAGVALKFTSEDLGNEHLRGFIGKRVVIFIQDIGDGTE